MRCRKCGAEQEIEDLERCSVCGANLHIVTSELPPMPKWQEVEKPKSPTGQLSSKRTTGRLSINSLKSETSKRSFLHHEITLRVLLISGGVVAGLAGLIMTLLYISNLPALNRVNNPAPELPNAKALKLVQESPSTTKGLTVRQYTEQFAKQQQAAKYRWWVGQEKGAKETSQYLVIFIYNKDGKQENAIWVVDVNRQIVKAKNPLAGFFSGA
ncbi:MAG: hypothetical protein AB1489_11970 [Acidobacteriota bacterium]